MLLPFGIDGSIVSLAKLKQQTVLKQFFGFKRKIQPLQVKQLRLLEAIAVGLLRHPVLPW